MTWGFYFGEDGGGGGGGGRRGVAQGRDGEKGIEVQAELLYN